MLLFADAGVLPAGAVYRRELTVIGSRSATPAHMEAAVALLPELDLPEPDGRCRWSGSRRGSRCSGKGSVLKVVFAP